MRTGADEAAKYWDTHEYAYTMEYMQYGDVCINLSIANLSRLVRSYQTEQSGLAIRYNDEDGLDARQEIQGPRFMAGLPQLWVSQPLRLFCSSP